MYSGGSGTVLDPYLIATAQDFYNIRENLSAHFKQVADLDFVNFGEFIAPDEDFTGVYDGGNFSMKNAEIKGGLFGRITDGIIQNIKVENVNLESIGDETGVIARVVRYDSIIQNCRVKGGKITSTHDITGGIVGKLVRWVTTGDGPSIKFCWTDIEVNGVNSVGGIAGESSNANISDCYSLSDVYGSGSMVGGIVGRNTDSYSGFITKNCYTTGRVQGDNNVGGVVGSVSRSGVIKNNFALNPAIVRNVGSDGMYFGRIIGSNYGTSENNYALENMKFYPDGFQE